MPHKPQPKPPAPKPPKFTAAEKVLVRALLADLQAQATAYHTKKTGSAGDAVYLQPPPAGYRVFFPQG